MKFECRGWSTQSRNGRFYQYLSMAILKGESNIPFKLFQIFLDTIDRCPVQRKAKALAETHVHCAKPLLKKATKKQINQMLEGKTIKASDLLNELD